MSYAAARQRMVDSQIRTNKVTDAAVIQAIAALPRELFVPESMRGIAYVDEDIPIGGGRFLMEPMVLARLLQLAAIEPSDIVLDIGCGTGYSAALLARLANTVVALESDAALHNQAVRTLAELPIDNVVLVEGPLGAGHPKQAPYDAIIFDGAVEVVPQAIVDQLAEGGRLVAVIVNDGVGRATLMTRVGGMVSGRVVFDAATGRLAEFARPPAFTF